MDTSSFVIESAERGDEGRYTIKVTNPAGEDVASLFLRVVGEKSMGLLSWCLSGVGGDWASSDSRVAPLQMSRTPQRTCVSPQWARTGPSWSGSHPSMMEGSR